MHLRLKKITCLLTDDVKPSGSKCACRMAHHNITFWSSCFMRPQRLFFPSVIPCVFLNVFPSSFVLVLCFSTLDNSCKNCFMMHLISCLFPFLFFLVSISSLDVKLSSWSLLQPWIRKKFQLPREFNNVSNLW